MSWMVAYTFADVADDVCLLSFKIDSMPPYVFGVLKDILSVNQGAFFFVGLLLYG